LNHGGGNGDYNINFQRCTRFLSWRQRTGWRFNGAIGFDFLFEFSLISATRRQAMKTVLRFGRGVLILALVMSLTTALGSGNPVTASQTLLAAGAAWRCWGR